jgi:copper chaperone
MTTFEVKDMTCGHCVSTITKAVRAVDEDAMVQIDLATHRVTIDSTAAEAADLSDAINRAGYTPVAVEAGLERVAAKVTSARGGCCCG